MADQSPPTWNELYDRVPYRFIKFHYKSDFELNVRALNPRCVNITNFNQHLNEFMLNSTKNHQNAFTMKYLIEDLNNMISSLPEKLYQKMNALFDVERNMYKQGTLTLTQIDTDILWLLLQSKSNKTAVERYKVYYDSYNSCNMPELGNCIQVLSMEIVASINNVVKLMNIILQKIQAHRDHLNQSKREQVWSGETRKRFAEIQVWFDEVATIIDDTLETIQTMRIYDELCCVNENKLVIDTFKRLIKLTLVLEMEPTEIVKTENFTTCIIRLLCSNSTLQNAKFNINIKDLNVSILSEEGIDVGKVSLRNFKPERTGHDFYYHLKTLKVDKVRRSKSEHGFIENKYTLIFDLKIEVDKKEIKASVMSWPVLVIVHHTQEALARAALMWDKHLTGVDRSSKASVPWSEMRNVLRIYFKNVTGFELKDRQLDALYDKAIRENIIRGDNFYWEASCSKANKVNFMFWDWYYGAMKFIKDNIKNLWEEGLVEGFASNAFLEEQFPNYPIGTFLLRFSESTVGVLILMWVGEIEVVQVPLNSSEEFMMKNRTSNNLKESVIVNIIQDLKQCTQLCDGTPKDKAFKSFATTPSDKKSSDKITEKYKFLKIIHAVNNSSTSDENTAIAVSNSLNLNSPMPNNIYGSSMQGNIYSSPLPNNIYGSPVQSTTSGSNSPGSSMYARFTNQSPALPESHNDTTGMIWDPSSVDNYFFSNTEINNLTSILEDYEMTTPIQVDVINSLQSSVPSTPSPIVDPTPVPKFVDTFGNICNFKCSFN